jgi:hypothetical protein
MCPLTSAFTVISGLLRCVGTAGFEPATLDPQSHSGHRGTSLGRARWVLEQHKCTPNMAGRGPESVHVGSWNGSPCTDAAEVEGAVGLRCASQRLCLSGGAVVAITTSWRVHSPGPFGPGPLRRASQHQRFPTEGCPHGEHGQTPWRSRSFTPEFKAEMIALHQSGDWFIGQVARDFDVTEAAVRE